MAEKEYIERDLLIDIFNSKSDMAIGTPKMVFASAAKMIDALPAADVVEVVRCKDCISLTSDGRCALLEIIMGDNDYCSYGVPKPKKGGAE